ncbi:hypothetical protein GBA52_003136 [Prunus armeniaca]|nr:hypothetical protein GBA52_003136 [Prunus armeniaca]
MKLKLCVNFITSLGAISSGASASHRTNLGYLAFLEFLSLPPASYHHGLHVQS